jgi:hypothetical protein
MLDALTPILWAGLSFLCVLFMQRWIHRHLRGVTLLLTGNVQWSVLVYALVLLPGVFLHELSHWLTANLLGVRTGKFSLIPRQQKDGSIQLGYVEFYKDHTVGPVQETMIGGAPLVFGVGAILLIGYFVFGVTEIVAVAQMGSIDALSLVLQDLFATGDFWLWLYLLFAISNAMMPSASDRQAWPAFLLLTAVSTLLFATLFYIFGFIGILLTSLAQVTSALFSYLALAFSLTIAVNLIFMALIALLEALIGRMRGMYVIYGQAAEEVMDENKA